MRKKLTDAGIRRLQVRPGFRPELADGGCAGLYLILHESGRKTFAFRYRRPPSGRPAKLTLGTFDESGVEEEAEPKLGGLLTLAAARKLAGDACRAVKLGRDPGVEKLQESSEDKRQRKQTFEWACREFITRHARPKNRRWRETALTLGLNVDRETGDLLNELREGSLAKRWRDRPVTDLKRHDITGVLDEIADRGALHMANGVHALLRKLFNFMVERGVIDQSPLKDLKKPQLSVARDRVLTAEEIAVFWRACGRLSEPFGYLYRSLLVTGQRRDEVASMECLELNPLGDTWTIPAERAKNKREHVVPLSALARETIKGVTRVGKIFVFSTTGKTPVSGFSKAKAELDRRMLRTLRALGRRRGTDPKTVTLEPWRLHDLRRTCASGMAQLGIAPHIVEAFLNHKSGTVSGVAAVYNRYTYDSEKRQAAEAWSRLLLTMVDPPAASNVIALKKETVA